MASSDQAPTAMPGGDGSVPPGKDKTMGQSMMEKGAQMMQSLKPMKKMSQHVCTFALYSHDLSRQIPAHHYFTRLNQDFIQSAVYDSDDATARLIGVEYIISDRLFESMPTEEQRLWHSHGYEIKSGMWMSPRIPDMIEKKELVTLANTYGKFWCTWQVDRGDRLPLGAPALMVSPQEADAGKVKEELVQKRDEKYKVSCLNLVKARKGIEVSEARKSLADYWMKTGKGYAIDVQSTDMKTRDGAAFP